MTAPDDLAPAAPAPDVAAVEPPTAPRPARRGPVRRILGVLGGIATVLLVLAVAAIVVLSALGVARFVPVLSNSMAPGMPVGSLAVTLPAPRADVAVGDVVVFTAPVGPAVRVIHRVTRIYGPEDAELLEDWSADRLAFETKGDNNPAGDPWIVTVGDDEIWRRDAVVPYLGWPVVWLGDPIVRAIAFAAAGAGVTAWALTAVWRRPTRTRAGDGAAS